MGIVSSGKTWATKTKTEETFEPEKLICRLKLALSRPSVFDCVRSFAQSKIMTFKKFLPKSTMYTQSASRSLSHNSDRCNRQKSTKTLRKLSLKLFANSQRERRCDVCVCVCLWAWCFLIRCVDVAVVEPVVRSIPARKSLYVSHLENRLNILSIRGNKNKFFSFRDLISCFCWERVRAVAFVCVATECWARFCVLKSAISVFSLVYHRRRRRCVLYCCFSRLSVADTPTPFDFVSQKQNSSS